MKFSKLFLILALGFTGFADLQAAHHIPDDVDELAAQFDDSLGGGMDEFIALFSNALHIPQETPADVKAQLKEKVEAAKIICFGDMKEDRNASLNEVCDSLLSTLPQRLNAFLDQTLLSEEFQGHFPEAFSIALNCKALLKDLNIALIVKHQCSAILEEESAKLEIPHGYSVEELADLPKPEIDKIFGTESVYCPGKYDMKPEIRNKLDQCLTKILYPAMSSIHTFLEELGVNGFFHNVPAAELAALEVEYAQAKPTHNVAQVEKKNHRHNPMGKRAGKK